MSTDFYRLSDFEVAVAWVFGYVPWGTPFAWEYDRSPRSAIEASLRAALQRPPCVIAFSGGRDSSALLALAVRLARREGLESPIAVTRVHPGVPQTDERMWQERVVRHVRVAEWVRLEFTDELDILGPVAVGLIGRFGVLWPPMVHTRVPLLHAARGGSLVTGEGGDELFGHRRFSLLRAALTGQAGWRAGFVRAVAGAAGPRQVRHRLLQAVAEQQSRRPWLRPHVQQAVCEQLLRDAVAEPLLWPLSTRQLLRRRSWASGERNIRCVAAAYDVECHHPLLDPLVLGALAGRRPLGFADRAAAMETLFGDVLPKEIITRRGKAAFNAVAFGRHARGFVADWPGDGLDETLVDVERLREEWSTSTPHGTTTALLQSAWLHSGASAGS